MAKHTDDLHNVREEDSVEITTTEGETFLATCTGYQVQHADPRSGEIRETTLWIFETPETQVSVRILDGLKSSPDDPDFPQHTEMWDMGAEESIGYIEEMRIFGRVD